MNRRGFLGRLLKTAAVIPAAALPASTPPHTPAPEPQWWEAGGQSPCCIYCGFYSSTSSYSPDGKIGKLWVTEEHRPGCPRFPHHLSKHELRPQKP